MRNIFDQYTQPENRLTHSLASVLYHDKELLKSFLHEFGPKAHPSPSRLQIIEQGLPGKVELEEGEAIKQGLPDALIFDDEGWAWIFESKISSGLTKDQLRRHTNTILKCGYDKVFGLAITVAPPGFSLDGWHPVTWKQIYIWGNKHKHSSPWAKLMTEYFEVAEAQMAQDEYLREGTITEFSGVSFNPYTYLEGKRVLRLLMQKIRENKQFIREMGIDQDAQGRSSITRQDLLWDFMRIRNTQGKQTQFQCYPHCTVGIGPERAEAMITFPHGMSSTLRNRLSGDSYDEFAQRLQSAAIEIDNSLKGLKGYRPVARIMQRRYQTQRSVPYKDAVIEFDPRVTLGMKKPQVGPPIKQQEEWARATYELLKNKRSNLQFQIGAEFYHNKYDELNDKDADKYFIAVFTALKAFLRPVIQ